MNELCLDYINKHAPYQVTKDKEQGYYRFTSKAGVEFLVGFDKDEILLKHHSYQLIIANVNHKPSPRDTKVKTTISVIIEAFFQANNVTMLYICDTGDGKQKMRSRLFGFWFSTFVGKSLYTMLTATVKDEEGIDNYVALISRTDNPYLAESVNIFSETIQLLSHKPEQQ